MRKKDILELKKRYTKNQCTFGKLSGCYVNSEKHAILKFQENFLNLEEDEFFKYLEIAKKVLSGTIGNNLLELNFELDENFTSESQSSLIKLRNSELKDNSLLDAFYELVIQQYDYEGNYLILLYHDAYDVTKKTTDEIALDESEEVYQYILCAICPVSLSDAGLRYFEEEQKIKARIRDWIVKPPVNGFVFPAFIERSADVNSVMYYTKNPKDTHIELMESILGCESRQTAKVQKEIFQTIITDTFRADEEVAEKIFMDVQDNLNMMIEEYNSIYDDTDHEPITLTPQHMQDLLLESGVPEEISTQLEEIYEKNFNHDLPLAENLIDAKVLKANEQRKKEEGLIKQVGLLQTQLEQVKDTIVIDTETASSYDIVVQVKPEKASQIKEQVIDGQRCLVIPIGEDEHTIINGLGDFV